VQSGARRGGTDGYHPAPIGHYVYAGHTALHVAAAAHQRGIVQQLVALGADVRARNRHGAEARRRNKSGSTALVLARHNTGRGGTGSVEAKAELARIVRLLKEHGASG
jgi:hypothetical protein